MKVVAIWHGRSWCIKGLQRMQTMREDWRPAYSRNECSPSRLQPTSTEPPDFQSGVVQRRLTAVRR